MTYDFRVYLDILSILFSDIIIMGKDTAKDATPKEIVPEEVPDDAAPMDDDQDDQEEVPVETGRPRRAAKPVDKWSYNPGEHRTMMDRKKKSLVGLFTQTNVSYFDSSW